MYAMTNLRLKKMNPRPNENYLNLVVIHLGNVCTHVCSNMLNMTPFKEMFGGKVPLVMKSRQISLFKKPFIFKIKKDKRKTNKKDSYLSKQHNVQLIDCLSCL